MSKEENINNPYTDIVDNSILGNSSEVSKAIQGILNQKISNEIDDMKNTVWANSEEEFDEEEFDDDIIDEEEPDDDDSDLED